MEIPAEALGNRASETEKTIQLTFQAFDIEDSSNCEFDYVEIEGHQNIGNRTVERFCGNSPPGPFYSVGTTMIVRIVTDSDVARKGFTATVQSGELLDEAALATTSTTTSSTTTTDATATPTTTTAATTTTLTTTTASSATSTIIKSKNYPDNYDNNYEEVSLYAATGMK